MLIAVSHRGMNGVHVWIQLGRNTVPGRFRKWPKGRGLHVMQSSMKLWPARPDALSGPASSPTGLTGRTAHRTAVEEPRFGRDAFSKDQIAVEFRARTPSSRCRCATMIPAGPQHTACWVTGSPGLAVWISRCIVPAKLTALLMVYTCEDNLKETLPCGGVEELDCVVTSWTHWGACPVTCGGAQHNRQRQIRHLPRYGIRTCPQQLKETQGCGLKACSEMDCQVSDWEAWQACTTTCGIGQQMRKRDIIGNRTRHGDGCSLSLEETMPCTGNQSTGDCNAHDCKWGFWNDWSACTCSCDGGQKQRTRHVFRAALPGGKSCDVKEREEIAACSTHPCNAAAACVDGAWSAWKDWTQCSVTCGGGTSFRSRIEEMKATACGTPATGKERESKFCNIVKCNHTSVDCVFGDWVRWGACSGTCNGVKRRSRQISRHGTGFGESCIGPLKQIAPCNVPGTGQTMAPGCGSEVPNDCKLSTWGSWSICSTSCGRGEHIRNRTILVHPKNGGKICDGALSIVANCHGPVCPSPLAVNCKPGDWQDWARCDKCSGQRKRYRNGVTLPSDGGNNCDQFVEEEVGKCPRKCGEKAWCSWSDWGEWGSCSRTCGEGKRSRRRHLELSDRPEPQAEISQKYSELYRRTHTLESSRVGELAKSFAVGCLCAALLLAGLRVFLMMKLFIASAGQHTTMSVRSSDGELLVGSLSEE